MKQKLDLIFKLYEIEAIKFGNFTLKSGVTSPLYIDLRLIVSYPSVLEEVSSCIWNAIHQLKFDLICGVPYTALPIATAISIQHDIPMIMRRKEVKDYGTKKSVEGHFQPGQSCLVIEDVITSGVSISETIEPLEKEQLVINDVVVLIDREQGGKQILAKQGYVLHSVFTISHLLGALEYARKIDHDTASKTLAFIKEHQLVNVG